MVPPIRTFCGPCTVVGRIWPPGSEGWDLRSKKDQSCGPDGMLHTAKMGRGWRESTGAKALALHADRLGLIPSTSVGINAPKHCQE